MLNPSFRKYFEDILKQAGYNFKPSQYYNLQGIRIFVGSKRVIVVVSSLEIPPAKVRNITQSIDDFFKRLRDLLVRHNKRSVVTDLVLPGGGCVPIPEWFKDWCKQNGISLHVLDAESDVFRVFGT